MKGMWKVLGYDTFVGDWYPVDEYPTEEVARTVALKKLEELERLQPTKDSGGQAENGIQDRIFIQRPDGSRYRVVPV